MRPSMPALAIALAFIVAGLTRPVLACLWDHDTLEAESKGALDTIRAITGRFERNPPLYYEMRLARSAKAVESDPTDLAAYDDAGVACDRLRRGDEAIAWMDRKLGQIEALERSKGRAAADLADHRYRHLANVGTFWVHRWARSGADRSRIAEVRTARDFIARAIELNPNAHFGREAYQLKALDWFIRPPEKGYYVPGFVDFYVVENRGPAAVAGLTGLVVLGDAWESVDAFNTLAQAIETDGNRASVALLAQLRAEELIDLGRRSLFPGAPAEPDLLKRDIAQGWRSAGGTAGPEHEEPIRRAYRTLRDEADAWQGARTEYMTARLKEGRHPDTDRAFWDDYRESTPPTIPTVLRSPRLNRFRYWYPWLETAAVMAAAVVAKVVITKVVRRNRGRPGKGSAIAAEV